MFLRPLLSLCVITRIFAASVAYQISPRAGNEFALEVTKTGLYNGKKHRFVFERYQGHVEFDGDFREKATVEFAIEKQFGVSGKKQILDLGLEKFNAACRASIFEYKADWEEFKREVS